MEQLVLKMLYFLQTTFKGRVFMTHPTKAIYRYSYFCSFFVHFKNSCIKPVFHQANLFARHKAKTRIQQSDWLAKKFAASSTNHVAEFLFSLRFARTNSPSGKRALYLKCLTLGCIRDHDTLH